MHKPLLGILLMAAAFMAPVARHFDTWEKPRLRSLPPPGAQGARGGGAAAGGGGGGRGGAPTPRAYRPEGWVEYTAPYDFMQNGTTPDGVGSLELIGPPWSQLTAFDLNTGKILWQVPNGGVTALGDAGKNTGSVARRGGVVVTGGGLVLRARRRIENFAPMIRTREK